MAAWSQLQQPAQRRVVSAGFLIVAVLFVLRERIRSKSTWNLRSLLHLDKEDHTLEIQQAERELYIEGVAGEKVLLVPFQGRVERIRIRPTPKKTFDANAPYFPLVPPDYKPNVDKVFLKQVLAITRICFPKWNSKEVGIIALHSFFLVMRTVLSLVVAWLDGRIVRDLVSADLKGFIKGLGLWFALAVPSTYTNSMLRYLQSKISLSLRTRLTRYTHDLYLSSLPNLRYYRAAQVGLEGADQYITADIASFSEALSSLYGNLCKPTLDMIIFTSQLSTTLGVRGTILMFANYYLTARILRAVTPSFGRLAAVEKRLEGEYRAGVSRVGREAEEIAFYNGGFREKEILWNAYLRLMKHVNSIYKIRIAYEWTEDFVIKYLWSAAGYLLISVPVFFTRKHRSIGIQTDRAAKPRDAVADRTESYIASRRLLLSLADAGGRLMYAYKDILELAGVTTRIYGLLSTLHSIPPVNPYKITEDLVSLSATDIIVNERREVDPETGFQREEDVLVKDLSFELKAGEHLMITGANGVGKSAIARVLKGLWDGRGGTMKRPVDCPTGVDNGMQQGIFFVPQRPYHVTGTLLDQVIYPHTYVQHLKYRRTEAELMEILHAVHLDYLPEREGGWFTKKEWKDILSGGEKQRMGIARVLYHRPRFAVLDECTSAVSSDVEGSMYQYAKDHGISLITISLRPSLSRYHTHVLTISGDESSPGGWHLQQVGSKEEQLGIEREIALLEAKLSEEEKWKARVEELRVMLSATTVQEDATASETEAMSTSEGISMIETGSGVGSLGSLGSPLETLSISS